MDVGQAIGQVRAALAAESLHYGHGTDNPKDEAAWIVLHAVGAPLDGSFSAWQQQLTPAQQASIQDLLARRIGTRKPLAYLLGSAWFAGLQFEVNESVLVPRSPIAELILEHFEPWLAAESVHSALDLCTGSGCIAIAMARHLPWLQVDASDISPAALEVARRNVLRHGVESRVRLYCADLFERLPGGAYGLITANPPYVPRAAVQELPAEYRAEPELGLVSGDDGLDVCLRIMVESHRHLGPGGLLVCEVGESAGRLSSLLPAVAFTWVEFSAGGSGVFVLGREELQRSAALVAAAIEDRKHVG